MSNGLTRITRGDTLSVTVKGKVADPDKADTSMATMLRISRSAGGSLLSPAGGILPEVRVEACLERDAEVTWEITSQFKNGVHLDGRGRYWMRKPEGWFEMSVADSPIPSIPGTMFTPPSVQRLREDKE